ncbi:GTP 3',8-cyclase MoaA [Desulfogranum japonicum]|uniref:GTP 3',8-cyclase MoaA n=1 Tax=Desulfogranum japonicum TaxID=231447 RepID=UPI0004190A87|nr:GTP 3',8-cyclase MoaA [Desulfogranum japonicum]
MNKEIASSQTSKSRLVDLFSRSISYLRLSLTDRCNLRCIYCVTEDEENSGLQKVVHAELLTYEELLRIVSVAVDMGISKVRLTGGEPLVRRNVIDFIYKLGQIQGLTDVRLTTNGVLLEQYAEDLLHAGVTKVNISLDTLKPERFKKITGVDCFEKVWKGLHKAIAVGFSPVKVNVVAMRNINDDEFTDFVELARTLPLQIRFIEFMPIGESTRWGKDSYISSDEIKERLMTQFGRLTPVEKKHADGPAQVFQLEGDCMGSIGFISPMSHKFCDRCNRLRLTSAGTLRSCLLCDQETDLKSILRAGATDEDIRKALVEAIRSKPKGHELAEQFDQHRNSCHGQMSRIGG